MSSKGNGWVNAPTENLWGRLNVGRLYGKRFTAHREAMDEVIDWLTFYNHRRLHSTLGYVSPMKFEASWHAAQPKEAAYPTGSGLRRTGARSQRLCPQRKYGRYHARVVLGAHAEAVLRDPGGGNEGRCRGLYMIGVIY